MRVISALLFSAFALVLGPSVSAAQVTTPNPVVERLEPTSGPPGTVVQMIGRNFRTDQHVLLGTTELEVRSRMPNRWQLVIPAGATSGRIEIRLATGTAITGPEFRVTAPPPPPTVAAIEPSTATVGSEVRIRGENFSPRATDNSVSLNGLPVVVRSASPTELVVIVPTGATNGPFLVRVAGSGEVSSPPVTITLGLLISSFAPTIAAPGMQVTITGNGFLARTAHDRVFLGSARMRVLSATSTSLVVEVPEGAATGNILVELQTGGRTTSATPLTIRAMPTITAIDPVSGVVGATLHVRGTGFGTDIRAVQALVGTVPLTLRGITDTDLTVEIPAGATTGPLSIAAGGLPPVIAPSPLTVLVPLSLASFAPQSGPAGSEVTITGAGFSTTLTENRVTLAGLPCEILAATPTELRVRVPATTSGPLAVEVLNAGAARTSQPFVITTPPVITSFAPLQAVAGASVVITGTNFGANASLLDVTFGGVRAQVRSATATTIEALVPAAAVTGPIAVTVRLQGTSTSSTPFRVLPAFTVSAAVPGATYPGQQIVIRGTGFGAGTTVRFAGTAAPAVASVISATEIRAYVPEDTITGPMVVRVEDGREASTIFEVDVTPDGTEISSVTVDCSNPRMPHRLGTTCRLYIRGRGLGTRLTTHVTIVGQPRVRVRVRAVTPYHIEAEVPRGTPPGVLHLSIPGAEGEITADSESVTFESVPAAPPPPAAEPAPRGRGRREGGRREGRE